MNPTRTSVLLILALATPALADTIRVPGDFDTIQAAVNAAQNGDTIEVGAGVYEETVDVNDFVGLRMNFANGAILRGDQGGVAFDMTRCVDSEVRGLTVEGSNSDGILAFDCTNVTFSRCSVSGSNGPGIYIEDSPGTRLERCDVSTSGSDGILVDSGSEDCVLTRCTIDMTDSDGIYVDASGTVIDRCVISRAGNFGIGMADDEEIENVRITRCRVSDTFDDGIVVNGTGTLVERCVVTDSGEDSIDVESAAVDCIVQRCRTIRGVWGLDSEGSGCTITKNKIVQPTQHGIGVTGTDNVITKNKVAKPGDTGIFVAAAATGNDIEKNGIKKAEVYGAVLEGSGNTLTKNKSKKSGTAGLDDRSGGGNTLTKNKLQ